MYEYRGLKAEAWDVLRGDTSQWPDRAFYLDVIARSGQPVLDVGCGTGRLLLDYLAKGIDIEGVDNSTEMLDLCRQKARGMTSAPVLHEQEMAQLDLPRLYRTILVPSSSLQLLVKAADAQSAVARLHAHLEPGGVLVASFMKLRSGAQPLSFDWIPNGEAQRADGTIIRRFMRGSFDRATSLESSEERFEVVDAAGDIIANETHSSTVREYSQAEAIALYKSAGFAQVEATDGFTLEPAHEHSRIFCVLGTRA